MPLPDSASLPAPAPVLALLISAASSLSAPAGPSTRSQVLSLLWSVSWQPSQQQLSPWGLPQKGSHRGWNFSQLHFDKRGHDPQIVPQHREGCSCINPLAPRAPTNLVINPWTSPVGCNTATPSHQALCPVCPLQQRLCTQQSAPPPHVELLCPRSLSVGPSL